MRPSKIVAAKLWCWILDFLLEKCELGHVNQNAHPLLNGPVKCIQGEYPHFLIKLTIPAALEKESCKFWYVFPEDGYFLT